MKLIDFHEVDCHHKCYIYSHRVKGVRHEIKIIAFSPDRAIVKAWDFVKNKYKELKQK